MEKWSPIPETHYSVSTKGRIRNDNTGRIKADNISRDGYNRVELYQDGIPLRKRVHRLVATAFIPNPDNKPQVNHIDGNKLNNNVDNLEWVDNSQNMLHAYQSGLHPRISSRGMLGKKNPNGGAKGKAIICIETDTYYRNVASAARQLGIPDSCIFDCLSCKSSHAHGLHFKYAT